MNVNYQNTYWCDRGKYQMFVTALNAMVPPQDEVPNHKQNPALEKFRKASNCYYDLYNNGLCNRAAEFYKVFGFSGKGAKNIVGLGYQLTQDVVDKTEVAMDAIILNAAAEQGLLDSQILTEQHENALKLAYIKLVQVGGFEQIDGEKIPDIQAKKQILDAIHTFDPEFQFDGTPVEEER